MTFDLKPVTHFQVVQANMIKSAHLACQTIDKSYSWLTSGIGYLGDNLSNQYRVRGSNEAIGLSDIMHQSHAF